MNRFLQWIDFLDKLPGWLQCGLGLIFFTCYWLAMWLCWLSAS